MAGHTENEVFIAAPLEVTWTVTNDLTGWTELFTEYKAVEVLSATEDSVTFRLTMFADENGVEWTWVSRRTLDPAAHEVRAERVETGPFEYMRILWRYRAEPGGTVMTWTQDFAMKPTAPVDDAQMERRINTNSPVQLASIKSKVEALVGTDL